MAKILFNERPASDIDLIVPECKWEQWHDRNTVNLPDPNVKGQALDRYIRFPWTRIEGPTLGSYNWSWLDAIVNDCYSKKMKLHFGLMTVYHDGVGDVLNAGGVQYDGAVSVYPAYLHTLMQAESVKDWVLNGGGAISWIPNGNSPSYVARLLALYQAIKAHYVSIGRWQVIGRIDIRGWGNWGEIHSGYYDGFVVTQYPGYNAPNQTNSTFPSVASFKAIIDAHKTAFPDKQLQAMISWFDAGYFNNTKIPAEVAEYILDSSNTVGPYGVRFDNLGATDQYIKDYFEFNTRFFEPGNPFNTRLLSRWETSPITGEPPAWNPGDYFDLERQTLLKHLVSFGNGNYGNNENIPAIAHTRIRAAAKSAGFKIIAVSGDVSYSAGTITVVIDWINKGLTPAYEDWTVVIEFLNSSNQVVKTYNSGKVIKRFLPSNSPSPYTDNIPAAPLPDGTYSVRFYVKHTEGFRNNMPLYIQGGDSSNRYSIGTVKVQAVAPPPNPGPVVNAGGDIEITLPTDNVTLNGSATDDESIATKVWTRISGDAGAILNTPNEFVTLARNLKAGSYTFRLTATDNEAASNYDDVLVKVNAAPIPPTPPSTTPIVKQVELFAKVTMSNGSSQTVQVSAPDPTTISSASSAASGSTNSANV